MRTAPTLHGFRAPHLLAGLAEDTPVAVALSGGADSVALLCLLKDCKHLSAVHVHHGIRGEEADRDLCFCEALAASFGIPFFALRVDAPARARATGESPETAAREARYAAISALLAEKNIPLLATAHHADDQLETMLQHLLRGSGLRGLCGIPACRPLGEGTFVVRPLLTVPKQEILAYLAALGQDFVTDSTNLDDCCERNMLRHRVLPILRELRGSAAASAARCAEALAEDEAFLQDLATDFFNNAQGTLRADALRALPAPVLVRVMGRTLPHPPTVKQMKAIRALLSTAHPHAALSLEGGWQLCLDRGILTVRKELRGTPCAYTLPLVIGENRIDTPPAVIYLLPYGAALPADAAHYRYKTAMHFREDAVIGTLTARPRKAGDTLLHGGMHKAVRRLSGQSHLSPALRAAIPLLTDDNGVLAVPFSHTRDGAAKSPTLTAWLCFD